MVDMEVLTPARSAGMMKVRRESRQDSTRELTMTRDVLLVS
jgi:hypothetical protein